MPDSRHTDRGELFQWMGYFKEKPKLTFCVHGEGEELEKYAQAIRDNLPWNEMAQRIWNQ